MKPRRVKTVSVKVLIRMLRIRNPDIPVRMIKRTLTVYFSMIRKQLGEFGEFRDDYLGSFVLTEYGLQRQFRYNSVLIETKRKITDKQKETEKLKKEKEKKMKQIWEAQNAMDGFFFTQANDPTLKERRKNLLKMRSKRRFHAARVTARKLRIKD